MKSPVNGDRPTGFCAVQDERIDALETRADDQEETNVSVLMALTRIETVQGRAPDPLLGDPGSGQMRILHGLANALLTGEARSPLQSIADADESDTTAIMDRPALVGRAREAEIRVRRLKIISGVIVTAITTVGALALAYLTR